MDKKTLNYSLSQNLPTPLIFNRPKLTLHLKKSLSYPTESFFPKRKLSSFFKSKNVKKIGLLVKENPEILEEKIKDPIFWLINDEIKETNFIKTYNVSEVRSFKNYKKLLLCTNKETSQQNLVKFVNLGCEIKKRTLFPNIII